MNSTDSKSSAFRTHFRAKLKKDMKSFAPLVLLNMLGFPLLAAASAYSGSIFQNEHFAASAAEKAAVIFSVTEFISVSSLLMVSLIILIRVFSGFRYLHRKPETDTVFSLPLTRNQLFRADYLSGLLISVVPYIIAAVTAILIIWFSPGHSLCIPSASYCLSLTQDNSDMISETEKLFKLTDFASVSSVILEVIPVLFMLYTFAVMISVCCGTVFEAILYFIGSNLSAVFFSCIVYLNFNENIPNIEYGSSYEWLWSELFTPAGGIIHCLRNFSALIPDDYYNDFMSAGTLRTWALWHCLFAAVYLFASWKMFVSRKAEDTSKPFVYSFIFYATSFFITGTAATLICAETSFYSFEIIPVLLFTLFICAVIFFIMLLIKYRGIRIKNIRRQAAFLLGSFIVTAAFAYLCEKTNGFGAMYYIPSADSIESVEIYDIYNPERPIYLYENSDGIKSVLELHSALNEEMKTWYRPEENLDLDSVYNITASNPIPSQPYAGISLVYTLKNGTKTGRCLTPVYINIYDYLQILEVY